MPIKFNCPKCKKELVVKDELAGKQGKCPACQAVLTVPAAPSPVTARPGPVSAKKKPVDDEDDEVVAEVYDDDEEDEAPRKKKKNRRDDDEEEDEEDDRRSRSKRRSSRRDDDEDDDDDDDDRRSSRKKKSDKRNWKKAGTAMLLGYIGGWTYTGAFALLSLVSIIGFIMTLTAANAVMGGGGIGSGLMGAAGFVVVFVYLAFAAYLASLVLNLVSAIFLITVPGKNGEFGLAITALALDGAALLFCTLFFVAPAIMLVLPLIEMARLVLYAILLWAVCKSLRARDTASSAVKMAIVAPCSMVGGFLIVWLMGVVFVSNPGKGTFILMNIVQILVIIALTGVMAMYALMIGSAKEEM